MLTWDAQAFAIQAVKTLDEEVIVGMCVKGERNGAFVVAELCEALMAEKGDAEGRKEARKTLKGWFGKKVVKEIESGEGKGKKVLLDKISSL